MSASPVLCRLLAEEGLTVEQHRERARQARQLADAHEAVADALERLDATPILSPLAASVPPPEPPR